MVQVIHFGAIVQIWGISERNRHILFGGVATDMTNIPQIHPLRSDFGEIVRSPVGVLIFAERSFFAIIYLYIIVSLYNS